MKPRLCIFILILAVTYANCAKILGVFPAPGYSQFILAEALMQELANRGHQVTVISAFRPKNETSNYKTILVDQCGDMDLFALENGNLFTNMMSTFWLGNMITETTLKNSEVQHLLNSDEKFDVVIVEKFFTEALEAFAEHFSAPLVLFSSLGPTEWSNAVMGNPALPSISTISWTAHTRHMSFMERIVNLSGTIFDFCYKHLVAYPRHQRYINEYFPRPLDLQKIIYNASLMLLNSHVVTSENAPRIHGMVEIGGFYIKEKPLDKQIQKYLDDATDGAILFSLGSNLKSADLPPETLDAILKTLGRLKQRVLWKFETDLPNKPANVLISKWLKQSDILAHPNVQLFITHGGLLSVTEAVFYGVPMVGIPIFGDQKMNIARVDRGNFGKLMAFKEITEESFFAAVNETLSDPRYQRNARLRSNIMRDGVVRPLELAMYWIEYVIRYGGTHFKPPAVELYWFQLYMLDIFASFVLFVVVLLYIVRKLIENFIIKGKEQRRTPVVKEANSSKNKKRQ